MDDSKQERIRQRAQEIWEQEGRPEGRAQDHWDQATRELDSPDGVQPDDLTSDLDRNPGIGSSPGATPEDLEDFEGENTFEGDVGNDTEPDGSINPGRIGRTNW